MLLVLLNKAGDNTHLTEVYELLAHGYVQAGELEKSRDYYLKLTQLEPENQLHARNYQQVIGRMGTPSSSRVISAEEGAVMVDELEATAPFIDQRYSDEVALAVRAALTDAELFISYNMPAKALGPLLSALPHAPRDMRVNQRLAALHTRAARFTEAAVCCRNLESVYHDAGYPEEATRYGELAAKYEERGSGVPAEHRAAPAESKIAIAEARAANDLRTKWAAADEPAEFAVAAESPDLTSQDFAVSAPAFSGNDSAEVAIQSAPAAESEIDLSAEWEGSSDEPADSVPQEEAVEVAASQKAANPAAIAEAVEEVRFYLSNAMGEEARAAYAKLRELHAEPSLLAELRQEIEAGTTQASPVARPVVAEISVEPVEEIDPVELPVAPTVEMASIAEPESAPEPTPKVGGLDAFVNDLESSLGDGFLPQTPAQEAVSEPEPQAPAHAAAASAHQPAAKLDEFVSDLEASLGDGFLAETPAPPAETKHEVRATKPTRPSAVAAKPAASEPTFAPPEQIPVAKAAAAAQAGAASEAASAPATFTYHPTPARTLAPQSNASTPAKIDSSAGVDLADMFGELKHELEEDFCQDRRRSGNALQPGRGVPRNGLVGRSDRRTAESLSVGRAGHPFPNIMQTYTWLSQCFLDKGVPEAAIRWYEKALKLSTIDADTRTALHYELASSYETAGDKASALHHFMEVYGSNIDYRDVAERIKTLKS